MENFSHADKWVDTQVFDGLQYCIYETVANVRYICIESDFRIDCGTRYESMIIKQLECGTLKVANYIDGKHWNTVTPAIQTEARCDALVKEFLDGEVAA